MARKTYIIFYLALYRKHLHLLYIKVTRGGRGGRLEDLGKIPLPAPHPHPNITQVILTWRMG